MRIVKLYSRGDADSPQGGFIPFQLLPAPPPPHTLSNPEFPVCLAHAASSLAQVPPKGRCDRPLHVRSSDARRGVRNPRDKAQRAAWRADSEARARVTASIASVLREMWNQQYEIPFIACFRKEVGPSRLMKPLPIPFILRALPIVVCNCQSDCLAVPSLRLSEFVWLSEFPIGSCAAVWRAAES